MNAYLDRKKKASAGIHGVRSEKRVAKRIGARTQIASGALPGAKGDMTAQDFLIEAKSTVNGSLAVTLNWLSKIAGEAENVSKTPALAITFVRSDGTPQNDASRWVMITEDTFKKVMRILEENAD